MQMIKLSKITEFIQRRKVNENGVKLLAKSIEKNGYLENNPVVVVPIASGKYKLIDGRHRYEGALSLGTEAIPAVVKDNLSDLEQYQFASTCNYAAETIVPNNMVSDAEFIWAKLAETENGKKVYTQSDVAIMLSGWEIPKVKKYAALNKISREVWENLIVPDFLEVGTIGVDKGGTSQGQGSTFSENLLRPILPLTPDNQYLLVNSLINDKNFNKARFTKLAEAYRGRDKAADYVFSKIAHLGNEYLAKALKAIDTGAYDKEWAQNGKKQNGDNDTPIKTDTLIQAQIDAYEEKNNIVLIRGDFYTEVKRISDESIDAIVTDPPFNISKDRVYTLENQADWDKNFGEWDNQDNAEFFSNMTTWASEFFRVLKPGKTGFLFVGQKTQNIAEKIFKDAGFEIKGIFFWCKTNPGVSVSKADFMPAMDMAIQFVKPGATRVFNYPGEPKSFDYMLSSVCQGEERIKNPKGETLHPTQKPEAVIAHLIEIITDIGDKVLDGFMGTGTTPAVAKRLQRKCIGIEKEKQFFDAAQLRLA